LLQVALFDQYLPERNQNINPQGMIASKAGSCAIENLLQQADGSVDITGAPHRNSEFVSHLYAYPTHPEARRSLRS
jgi:hypothetical protein